MTAWALLGWAMALGCMLIQVVLWLRVYRRVGAWTPGPEQGDLPRQSATLIICARNEADNLAKHLPRFLSQTDRSLQVMVVDDNSTDHTGEVLLSMPGSLETFTTVIAPPKPAHWKGKKWPLEYGIRQARHNVLLLTDADGEPASDDWEKKMTALIGGPTRIVLGYAPYKRRPGWLNRLIRFETAWTAIQYLGWALAGHPYMGVGRNLAYTKDIFLEAGGLARHADLPGGDDDLFLQEVATGTNTSVQLDPSTFVYSEPESTWRDWLRQKRRHLSTSWRYKRSTQVLLGLHAASLLLFYPGLWLTGGPWWIILGLILVRWTLITWWMGRSLQRLGEQDLIRWIPILDTLYLIYLVVMTAITVNNQKPSTWK
ncbi:MAG: glycosyltransferase [Saprospiraceae bacterium]